MPKKVTTESFIQKANKIHNNKYDYSLVEYSDSSTKEVIKEVKGGAEEMSKLERKLQKQNKEFKYTPKIKFEGSFECFNKVNYE